MVQHELEQLVHIGGMSHYFEPSARSSPTTARRGPVGPATRTSAIGSWSPATPPNCSALRCDAEPAPVVPDGLAPALQAKMQTVHAEVVDLIEAYRGW